MTAQIKEGELLYHVKLSFFLISIKYFRKLNQIKVNKKKNRNFGDFFNLYIDLKNSSNKFRKSAMLRYCMALPLQNEPKHSYVGPAVTEIIYFLSRTVEF